MRIAARLCLRACLLIVASSALAAGSGGRNVARHLDKPYVILVSIDGFGASFLTRYDTPVLDSIAAEGVRADALIPVYPTLTFPNHYSIATGLYPARHRLIGNRFPSADRSGFYSLRDREAVGDGSWYGGLPAWVAAEQQGMVTAAYFFVGTEAEISGVRPTYWNPFNPSVGGNVRVDQVLEWLALPAERRPHFITLYFEHVDRATHDYGVGSAQSLGAIALVEGWLQRLRDGIAALPVADQVYLLVVSDHGQAGYRPGATPFVIDEVVNLDGVRAIDHGSVSFLYFDEPDPTRANVICELINEVWRFGQAVVPGGAPAAWKLRDDSLLPDVIAQADPQYAVMASRRNPVGLSAGDHGWAPEFAEMHGIFLATGPRLPQALRIPAIDAVDVYPLMMTILELEADGPGDGDPGRLLPLLGPELQP
ncbi:MAG: ectonucleotide pyrophosphatase/phosphodiesterase [Gammaproteobacteria bacterium]|nr:ectonucleotide pyrophosphatase/phosphodiesterase [Gammaproteobacteria bacterium]MDH5309594.1 ectonucleotide pyrophosphatase/phosphodiesterase [Gammaproteobacteria bacterium]